MEKYRKQRRLDVAGKAGMAITPEVVGPLAYDGLTIVLDSHRRIRTGEVPPTLTTKCNVAVVGEEMVKYDRCRVRCAA